MDRVDIVSINRIEYKGYGGSVIYDLKNNLYFGRVTDPEVKEDIDYSGKTIYELKEAFAQGVDDYLFEIEE